MFIELFSCIGWRETHFNSEPSGVGHEDTCLVCRVVKWLVLLLLVPASNAAIASHCDIDAERDNIRALPYGYVAVCERGSLKLRSGNSATFVIRDSCLCDSAARTQKPAELNLFTLCSNDPEDNERGDGTIVPRCAEIDFEQLEV